MAAGTGPGGGPIAIRPARKAAPDPAARPDLTVVVSGGPEDRVRAVVDALIEAGDPFEILVAGPQASAAVAIDPRVRVLLPASPDPGDLLAAAAAAARSDFLLPLLDRVRPPTGTQIRALREAMEPLGAFSYLPGSAASDLAILSPARGLAGRIVAARLPALFAGDRLGPFMVRRETAASIPFRGGVGDLEAKMRTSGRVVRRVRT